MTRIFFIISLFLAGSISCNHSASSDSQASQSQTAIEGSQPPDIPCFVYHRFGDDRYPSTNISIEKFEKHLQYLEEEGFEVITFGKAVDLLKAGKAKEQQYAVLTVDDAYKSFKTGAMPLLEKYDMPATVFANTESIGGNSYMDWETLKTLQEKGIEIGNHSHSHPHFLNKKEPEAIQKAFKADARKAQNLFEQHLGEKTDIYAYPYGEYNESIQKVVQEMGFKAAAGQHSGVMHPGSDFFALPRFPMASSFATLEEFKEKAQMKGLRVEQEQPREVVVGQNPPKLQLTINKAGISIDNLQCFVSTPASCKIEKNLSGNKAVVTFQADQPFKTRRAKYTVTAPSQQGNQWFWYSKLWVMPDYPENE